MSTQAMLFFDEFRNRLGINTCLLGRIDSVSDNRRAEISILNREDPADFPILLNVPVLNYRASGYEINLPVSRGDRVIVLLSQTDISDILQNGDKNGIVGEKYSLTDAIALPFNFIADNESYTTSNDLEIKRGSSVVRITESGDIVLEADNIRLGENATERVRLADGSVSSKVFAE